MTSDTDIGAHAVSPSLMYLHTVPHYSQISHCFFSIFHFSYGALLLFHIHPYHHSTLHLPLFSLIKCIQITHASLFQLVHICTHHPHISMPSFHSYSLANIIPSPSVSLLLPHFHLQNVHFLDIISFVHTLSPSLYH